MGYTQDADQIVLINLVKKELYKQKPLAHRFFTGKFQYQYSAEIELIEKCPKFKCVFTVPVSDMGETTFTDSLPAQLLIRYLDIL